MSSTDELARRISRLERLVGRMGGPQLPFSSLDDASIPAYETEIDEDNNIIPRIVQVIGRQHDGTHGVVTLNGPLPPTPAAPVVEEVPGGLRVRWQGDWDPATIPSTQPQTAPTPVIAPEDFARAEVHASDNPAFTGLLFTTLRRSIESPRGGEVEIGIPQDVDYYVRIGVRTKAGNFSVSAIAGPFRAGKTTADGLLLDMTQFGGTTVFYGETDPTADPDTTVNYGDLWLKTVEVGPPPQYVSYRRMPDDTWAELADQGASAALAQAIDAYNLADQAGINALAAAGAAAAAQSDADAAAGAASTAQSDADAAAGLAAAAQATADGKITVYRQTSMPTGGSYVANDLWIDTDDNNKLYAYNGTTFVVADDQRIATALTTAQGKTTVFAQASAPTTVGRTVGDEWIETDSGNRRWIWNGTAWSGIPTGAAGISATARDLGAITTYRQATAPTSGMLVGDFWIDSDDNKLYRYEGSTPAWVAVQDVAIQTAITNAATAQAVADGKMRIFVQTSAPTGLVAGDVGDMWIDTDDANVSYTWDGAAWVKRQLGNGAIQPQSLVASNVIATGTVTATLLESILVLTTQVVAGPVAGAHAEMGPGGFTAYTLDPDGQVTPSGTWGTGDDGFNLLDPTTKQTVVTLRRDGLAVPAATVSGSDLDGDGVPETGFTVYGRDISEWLDDRARGTIASGFLGAAGGGVFASGITTRFGLGEISLDQPAGRQFMIVFAGMHCSSTVAGDKVLYSLRFTQDGSTPRINTGQVMGSSIVTCTVAGQAYSCPPIITMGSFTAGAVVRILVTAERMTGTGSITTYTYDNTLQHASPFRLFAVEVGRDIADTFILNDGGGTRAGYTTVAAPPVKKTYTSAWSASFVGSYWGDGTRRTDTTDMVQGQTSYYPAGGNQKAIAGFMGTAVQGEIGKTVAQCLAGATISKVEIALHANHSESSSGGTAVIGYHGNTTLPATAPGSQYGAFGNAFFTRGQTRWITLPSSTWASWLNGTYRGITVGPGPTTSGAYYVRFDGSAGTKPALRITYSR